MSEHVSVIKDEDGVSLSFYIENDEIMQIGEELEQINENAYMNGENWAALIECYLENNAPEILEGYESDPEAGMYAAYFEGDDAAENAEKLAEIIDDLVSNKEELFDFVREHGEEIEWD